MFQYAAAKSLALMANSSIELDISFLINNQKASDDFTPRNYELSLFKNIQCPISSKQNKRISRFLQRFKLYGNSTLYNEPHFHFDNNFFKLKPPVILNGYFNSEMYFKNIRNELLHDFTFPTSESNELNKVIDLILNNKSLSLHIRRGDYLNPKVNIVHGICDLHYYESALLFFRERIPDLMCFIFSDDLKWAEENFKNRNGYIIVKGNIGTDSWKDMYLMSLCQHHIIANSTFSWWGAWLSTNQNKLICAPKKWFNDKSMKTNDLFPQSWKLL